MNIGAIGLAALALAGPGDLPGGGALQPEELTLDIVGPADAMLGDQVHLQARATGAVSDWKWSVFPAVDGLVMLDGGKSAAFSNRQAGVYVVVVSVADSWGHVAHDVIEFEILEPGGPKVTTPQKPVAAMAAMGPAPLEELVREWASGVNSNRSKDESAVVAGSFRAASGRITTGNMPADADPLSEVERQVRIALGPRPTLAWETFFTRLRRDLVERIRTRELSSPQTFAAAFDTIASGLDDFSEEKST